MEQNYHLLPKVSIIIPTKNRYSLLRQTLESIVNQTYRNWEALVVDDGSTDETIEQITNLVKHEPRIYFLQRSNSSSGAPGCRNQGIAAATGEYIIFLDSDDCLAPHCLENRVKVMQTHPNLDFAIFPCQLFQNQPGDVELLWNTETQENDIDRFLTLDIPWQTTSPIWKRQIFNQLGLWDESLLSWQDWELHLRALIKGLNYQVFSEPDCFWRMPQKESIGLNSLSVPHLHSHELLFAKIHSLLLQAQVLDRERQYALAGLYFWLAKQWISKQEKDLAIKVWNVCRKTQLISNVVYWEGVFYLKIVDIHSAEKIAQKYLRRRWSEKLMLKYSKTFRKTPLSYQEKLNNQVVNV